MAAGDDRPASDGQADGTKLSADLLRADSGVSFRELPQPAEPAPAESAASSKGAPDSPSPPLVIFDTDMGPDIDDVLALAMLHGYQKRDMIELAAVTVSRDSPLAARYVDSLNTFYGRPDIPIGIDHVGAVGLADGNDYLQLAPGLPHDIADAPISDAVAVQREVLAAAEEAGRRVIIIQTGFSSNLSRLLESGPDGLSPKSGMQLVSERVDTLSLMAGTIEHGFVEFNVEKDVPSMVSVVGNWPVDLTLSPFELGDGLHYPYASITRDLGWADAHPVRQAYEFRDLPWHRDAPPFYDMKTWDLTSVVAAVEPGAGYFQTSSGGTVVVDDSGRTTFAEGDGRHQILAGSGGLSAEQRDRVLARMIELVSDRP